MRRQPALLLVVVVVAVAGGCAGGGDATIEKDALPRLVLQPRDLPRAFVRFDEGRQVQLDAPPGARADPARFGRIDGWKARYRRSGSPDTRGPLVVESRADLFESTQGARDDLAALRRELRDEAAGGGEVLDGQALGDEAAAAVTFVEGTSPRIRFYRIGWRDDNVVAALFVNGFDGRIELEDVLALARKQQRAIARAAAR